MPPHADPRTTLARRVAYWSQRGGSALLRATERVVGGPTALRTPTRPLALLAPSSEPRGVASITPHLPAIVVHHGNGAPPAPWLPRTTAIDETWSYRIQDAGVAPAPGAVWLADGTALPELMGGIDRYSGSQDVRGLTRSRPRDTLLGTWCVMPRHTYYHFLLEDVPALLASLSAARQDADSSVSVVTAADLPKYVVDFLESTGAPLVRTSARKVRVETLVATGFSSGARVHPGSIQRIREHFGTTASSGQRILYVSRVGFRRSPSWEPRLIEELTSALPTVEVIEGDRLSLHEQVEAFAEASMVIGVHGAGLSNIVFSPPSCRVIEIATHESSGDHFWRLATQLNQDYRLAWIERLARSEEAVATVMEAINSAVHTRVEPAGDERIGP